MALPRKTQLSREEAIQCAYWHFVDGEEQQRIAERLRINIGRVNGACKAAETAFRKWKPARKLAKE